MVVSSLFSLTAALASIQPVSLIGPESAAPAGGSGDSLMPIISPDGRYVLFASTANNLVITSSNRPIPAVFPPKLNVYRRDRTTGTTALVSVDLTGAAGGDGDSLPGGISTNGQYVLFESSASKLVANDTNSATDVFVRDLTDGTTTIVSVSTNGGVGNGVCRGSVMTADGRYVAFISAANNLVPNDTNGIADVFVRDLQAQATALVSVGARAAAHKLSGAVRRVGGARDHARWSLCRFLQHRHKPRARRHQCQRPLHPRPGKRHDDLGQRSSARRSTGGPTRNQHRFL